MTPKKAGDAVAERNVPDPGARIGDHQRASKGRDGGAPAGKRLSLAQVEVADHDQRHAESPRPDRRAGARRIGPSRAAEHLPVGHERAERELPAAGPGQIEGADRIDGRQDDAIAQRGDENRENDERQNARGQLEGRHQQTDQTR